MINRLRYKRVLLAVAGETEAELRRAARRMAGESHAQAHAKQAQSAQQAQAAQAQTQDQAGDGSSRQEQVQDQDRTNPEVATPAPATATATVGWRVGALQDLAGRAEQLTLDEEEEEEEEEGEAEADAEAEEHESLVEDFNFHVGPNLVDRPDDLPSSTASPPLLSPAAPAVVDGVALVDAAVPTVDGVVVQEKRSTTSKSKREAYCAVQQCGRIA